MADQITMGGAKNQKTTLIVAGFLAALGSTLLMDGASLPAMNKVVEDPVVAKVLREARQHRSKGQWVKAVRLLKEHAIPNNPEILLNYAKLLARGQGVPRDLDKARDKLLVAIQHSFPKWGEAAYELGRVYRQSQGPDCHRIAFEWFVEAAQAGHMQAHAEIGRHYARGLGVTTDLNKALEHYRIAARTGAANSLVAFVQRVIKLDHPSFAKDDLKELVQEAIPSLEREAGNGRGSSAKVLGRLYRDGVLIDADNALAMMWFERGTRLGDSGAMVELALMLIDQDPGHDTQQRSIALLKGAADLQNTGALTELGRLHLKPRLGLDQTQARLWFERGANAGHAGSMMELARLELSQSNTPSSREQAIQLLERGAALGHVGCKKLLQKIRSGKGLEANPKMNLITEKTLDTSRNSISRPTGKTVDQLRELQRLADQNRTKRTSTARRSGLSGATVISPFGKEG